MILFHLTDYKTKVPCFRCSAQCRAGGWYNCIPYYVKIETSKTKKKSPYLFECGWTVCQDCYDNGLSYYRWGQVQDRICYDGRRKNHSIFIEWDTYLSRKQDMKVCFLLHQKRYEFASFWPDYFQ